MTDIEQEFENCRITIKQMKQYEPEPYYIIYFLKIYANLVEKIFSGIFEEAARDFGLYISEKINQQTFERNVQTKKDEKSKRFLDWYILEHQKIDQKSSSKLIKEIIEKIQSKRILKIKIMLRAKQRFLDDIFQEINVTLKNGKFRSKDELQLEIYKQTPKFLESINIKRKNNREPTVKENQIVTSTFIEIDERDFEIVYFAEIYLKTIIKIVKDSRKKIEELN